MQQERKRFGPAMLGVVIVVVFYVGLFGVATALTPLEPGSRGGNIAHVWANEGGDKVWRSELRAANDPNPVLNSVWDGARIISYDWDDPDTECQPAISSYDIDISHNSWGTGDVCTDFGVYDASVWAPQYDAIVNGVYGKRVSVVFATGNQQADCPPGWDTIGAPAVDFDSYPRDALPDRSSVMLKSRRGGR